jgi:hypothetical protein
MVADSFFTILSVRETPPASPDFMTFVFVDRLNTRFPWLFLYWYQYGTAEKRSTPATG